jgi:hypothetical protein
LLLFYKLQSVWAYYLRYHLRVQLVLLTLFVAVRLSHLGFNIMWPRAIRSKHNIRWYGQDSARYCWVLLSVILFANQNFLDDSLIGCSVSFLLKDFALNTSLFRGRDSVWEKSGF